MKNSKLKAVLQGAFFGMIISLVIAFFFMLFAQMAAGGVTRLGGESWLYFAVIVPFVVTFAIVGYYLHGKDAVPTKTKWLISVVSAFFVTWYSGTIGAIFGETIVRGGMVTINVEGTLIWGTIYAIVLLPITTVIAYGCICVFYELLLRNMKINM